MIWFIFCSIAVLIGIILGTQLTLLFQVIIFVILIIYLNSEKVTLMEIGAIIPYSIIMLLFVGMIIGNISWALQTDFFHTVVIPNFFIVK